jgi:DNA-binding MarR family transcriptional regulator
MHHEFIVKVRSFNRFYTMWLGLMDNHLLDSPYSLPEARVLFELYHHQPCTASEIHTQLQMDKGYLSRILFHFSRKGLLSKRKNKEDNRSYFISLTTKGNHEFEKINTASINQIKALMKNLTINEQSLLIRNMSEIQKIVKKSTS